MTYRFFLYIIKFQFSINNRYIELSISIIIIFLDIPNLPIVNLIFSKILIYRYLSITISIIASSIISKILKYRYLSIFVILLHIQTFQSCIIHYIIDNHNSYRYLSINRELSISIITIISKIIRYLLIFMILIVILLCIQIRSSSKFQLSIYRIVDNRWSQL